MMHCPLAGTVAGWQEYKSQPAASEDPRVGMTARRSSFFIGIGLFIELSLSSGRSFQESQYGVDDHDGLYSGKSGMNLKKSLAGIIEVDLME